MIWLLLGILSATLLFFLFRLFSKWNVNTFQAIVINYIVAGITGICIQPPTGSISEVTQQPWIILALILGSLFIGIFYLMAISSQQAGMAVTSVAAKMSLIIPVIAGVFLYSEHPTLIQWTGVGLALVAVWLTLPSGGNTTAKRFLLPVVIFFFSGVIDTLVTYCQNEHVNKQAFPLFSAVLFFTAAAWGIISYLVFLRNRIQWKTIVGGILLGIPNYFSIYFLLCALESNLLSSGTTVAINNLGVVALSTLTGIFFMNEKLTVRIIAGVVLALISIVLISVL